MLTSPARAGFVATAAVAAFQSRVVRNLRAVGIFLALLALGGGGFAISDMHQREIKDTRGELRDLGTVLSAQESGFVQMIDLLLLEMRSRGQDPGIRTPEEFRRRLGGEDVHRLLGERLKNLPQAHAAGLFDADGILVNTSHDTPLPRFSIADRDYFQHVRDHADPGVYVSLPARDRGTGPMSIFLARRVSGPDGTFLGLVVASVDVDYLLRFYQKINEERGIAVTLLRRDGIVLARYPATGINGLSVPSGSQWHMHVAAGGGTYLSPGYFSGVGAIVSVNPLRDFPLVIDVSIHENDALATWRRQASITAAGTIVLAGGFVALFSLIARQTFRQKQHEARLRDFAELASDWFWEQDRELRFTDVGIGSPLVDPRARPHIGKRRWEINDTGVDPDRWNAHQEDVLGHRRFVDFRFDRIGPDGRTHHVSVSGVPVHDASGAFTGYRGIGRDITASVTAAAELNAAKNRAEQAETMLRDAVDSMSEGFVIYDHEDRFVMCNETYRRIYAPGARFLVRGAYFEDILRDTFARSGNPNPRDREKAWVAGRLREHQQADGATEHCLPDGSCILVTDRRMKNGGIAGLRVNITALKQAQAALVESERRLRSYAEMSADWFWEQDAELRFRHDSDIPITSLPANEGKTTWDFADSAMSQDRWDSHKADLDARRPFRDFRWERIRTDGRRDYISISGDPIFDDAGTFHGYQGTGRDITADVEAAEALRLAKEQAEAGYRAKSEFLANMGHELRTPLHAIIGFSELIHDRKIDPLAANHVEWAGEILASGRHLLDIINDMLELSRIDAGQYVLADDRVDLAVVAQACLRAVGPRAEENRVTLDRVLIDRDAVLRADHRAVKQIMCNLMTNAVKFTPGGGMVSARIEHASNGDIVCLVADTGIGIDAAALTSLCEPFTQVDASSTRKYGGAGLGLAISRKLAALHGGALKIESVVGKGTTVAITFPASRVLVKSPARVAFATAPCVNVQADCYQAGGRG